MTSTEVAIEAFPKTLKQYSTSTTKQELQEAIENIERLRALNPAVYDEKTVARYLEQRAQTLKDLVEEYFCAAMSNKFPVISEELFALKRYLSLENKGNKWIVVRDDTEKDTKTSDKKIRHVEAPLFAYTPLFDGKHTAKLASVSQTRTSMYGDTYRRQLTITAKLPGGVGQNLRTSYRESLGHYFSVLAEMFNNPVAGDILYTEGNLAKPEVGAIWIPTIESLSVAAKETLVKKREELDPAMILKIRGKTYLVHTWNVDDEEPFEHYLREFSAGDLKGKLGK